MTTIATMPAGQFAAIGLYGESVHDLHAQLCTIVSNRLEADSCGAIFAIPEVDAESGVVTWLTNVAGTVRPLSAVAEPEHSEAQRRIEQCMSSIAQLADALAQSDKPSERDNGERLRIALRHPSENDWYLVGEQPVLINWGLTDASARTRREDIKRSGAVVNVPSAANAADGANGSGVTTIARGVHPDWLGWLLTVLVLVALTLLLSRCTPVGLFSGGAAESAGSALAEEARLRRDLGNMKRELDAARLACLQSGGCEAPAVPPADTATSPPAAEDWLDSDVAPIDDNEICSRIEKSLDDCETGAVSISLVWNSRDDLDLAIETPGGEVISWKSPKGGAGGSLNLDFNRELEKRSRKPVENISWPTDDLPPGRYRILGRLHDTDGTETGEAIDYTATLVRKGEARAFTGKFNRSDEGKSWRVIGTFMIP